MAEKETVLEALEQAGEPLKAGDIAERTGLDKKDVDKAIKALKAEGAVDSPKRCFYAPTAK